MALKIVNSLLNRPTLSATFSALHVDHRTTYAN